MTQQIPSLGRDLNSTFLPSTLLRPHSTKLSKTLPPKDQFQKTTGNPFVTIDPPQIKFAGYELDKLYTTTVKIINRAPIPQRVTFIPPEQTAFSIKHNKKGSIASGMAETITVVFRSNQHKYQTDLIRIKTETDNFVIPLYAYPTLPDLRAIFPKVIDFGAVELKESNTYSYPITNTVPINFEFSLQYIKDCQEISINPLKGIIPAHETLVIDITFTPTSKSTSIAQVLLHVQQFDFQPLPIRIIGSGMQSNTIQKRVKSSKLTPLREAVESKKFAQPLLKRRPSGDLMADTNNPLLATGTIQPAQLRPNLKKTNIRTSYSKLAAKKTVVEEEETGLRQDKAAEREYLNRFGRIQDLDKQKQIKFTQYLGDKAMTESEVQLQQELAASIQRVRDQVLEKKCTQRYNPEFFSQIAVEFKTVPAKEVTWDDKQNDQLHSRRRALLRLMNAATKVILKYRLLKRLDKIKDLLKNCKTKQDAARLVKESHSKAMDKHLGLSLPAEDMILDFGLDSIRPSFFQLQYEDNQKLSKTQFKTEGKASFDDLAEVKEIISHNRDVFKFSELSVSGDYFNHNSFIPLPRQSAEEEYFLKTAALGAYQAEQPTSAYSLPLKVPAHHFIYDQHIIKRYQTYANVDEKDPQVYLQNDDPIEDEFEGWTGGDMDILKYKFSSNSGCPYITSSGFNYSQDNTPLPPLATLAQNLPKIIQEPTFEDTIDKGDSDQEDLHEVPVESALKFLEQIEGNNPTLKERRSQKVRNPEKLIGEQIEKSLESLKLQALGEFVGRVKETNRWGQHNQNRFLL